MTRRTTFGQRALALAHVFYTHCTCLSFCLFHRHRKKSTWAINKINDEPGVVYSSLLEQSSRDTVTRVTSITCGFKKTQGHE